MRRFSMVDISPKHIMTREAVAEGEIRLKASIASLITKQIPGFGELFRKLSFDKIGSAAMMSRALAGLVKEKAVFCLPGSPDAVQTAMEQLILPELGHVIKVAKEHYTCRLRPALTQPLFLRRTVRFGTLEIGTLLATYLS